jgi:hypothetical protein
VYHFLMENTQIQGNGSKLMVTPHTRRVPCAASPHTPCQVAVPGQEGQRVMNTWQLYNYLSVTLPTRSRSCFRDSLGLDARPCDNRGGEARREHRP